MRAQSVVVFVVIAAHGRFFDSPVHSFDLAVPWENSPPDCFLILVTPGMVWLGQTMIDVVLGTGLFEGMSSEQFTTFDHFF